MKKTKNPFLSGKCALMQWSRSRTILCTTSCTSSTSRLNLATTVCPSARNRTRRKLKIKMDLSQHPKCSASTATSKRMKMNTNKMLCSNKLKVLPNQTILTLLRDYSVSKLKNRKIKFKMLCLSISLWAAFSRQSKQERLRFHFLQNMATLLLSNSSIVFKK